MIEANRICPVLSLAFALTAFGCDEAETVTGGVAGNYATLGSGGAARGGTSSGGAARGGTSSGGAARGGTSSGGAARGGTSSGGASTVAGTGSTGSGGTLESGIPAKCSALCSIAASKGCPGDVDMPESECVAECDPEALGVENCLPQYDAWLSCYLSHPAATWICEAQSLSASPPAGSCDAETDSVVDCAGP